MKKAELIYKFNTPLTSPMKQQWRAMNYNAYSIKWTDPAFDKISNMIKSGSTLKIHFIPVTDETEIKQALADGKGDIAAARMPAPRDRRN